MLLRPTTIITAILSGLLMTGCANQDNGKAKPDAGAFEWAMNQDIRFNTMIEECGKVDSEVAKKATAVACTMAETILERYQRRQ
jgi:uncharacterized lipoprotein NlpE involved in copper resistance